MTDVLTYELFALLIMTAWIHHLGDTFFDRVYNDVEEHNKKLKERLIKREISPYKYKEHLKNPASEVRFCLIINYLAAPILCPRILITFFLDLTIQTLTKLKN